MKYLPPDSPATYVTIVNVVSYRVRLNACCLFSKFRYFEFLGARIAILLAGETEAMQLLTHPREQQYAHSRPTEPTAVVIVTPLRVNVSRQNPPHVILICDPFPRQGKASIIIRTSPFRMHVFSTYDFGDKTLAIYLIVCFLQITRLRLHGKKSIRNSHYRPCSCSGVSIFYGCLALNIKKKRCRRYVPTP